MILRFILFLPVWLIGSFILPWPLVPIAVAMADEDGRLPVFFRWLETHDRVGWEGPLTEEATAKHMDNPKKALRRWLWRNRAYTLRYRMGMRLDENPDWKVTKVRGTETPRKIGPSYLYAEAEAGGKRYFEFQPGFGFYWLRIYFRIGWKVATMLDGHASGSSGIYTGISPRPGDFD